MKTFAKILFGFSAIVFAACSSNEPMDAPENPETPGNDVSFLSVSITAPSGASSRTTEDGGYEPSWNVDKEHKVTSADFYFFQSNGSYAFNATAELGDLTQNGTNGDKPNIEYICRRILVLNGVKNKDYPEYLITVLNKPNDFNPGPTLDATTKALTAMVNDNPENGFVMTTSSFIGDNKANTSSEDLRHDVKYFTTKLNPSDFKTSITDANSADPVEIYVERLKAKVSLVLLEEKDNTYTDNSNQVYYKVSSTLGGGNNATGSDGNQSQVDFYIKVIGWNLNATAQKSYMSKILDPWKDKVSSLWSGWNKPDDWRSFWAQSWTYGINDVDQSKLNYVEAKEVANSTLGTSNENLSKPNYVYCFEHTNSPDKIFQSVDGGSLTDVNDENKSVAVKTALVTHVVLHTQIYMKSEDGTMKPAGNLVQYMGVLYTADSFKNLLLNSLKAKGNLNFWLKTSADGATTETWKEIDNSFIVISRNDAANHKLGEIAITAKAKDGVTVYQQSVDASGNKSYTPYTSENFESTLQSALDAALAENNKDGKNNNPVGSDGNSDAFYYIPIEHYAPAGQTQAIEGYYGVVRNHWYTLSVKSFKKIGHLVFDPKNDDTPVIPEGPEDPLYYVGAKINILSWKVVNQTITDL
ncbi:MAG: Mfa1 family fimbria major subunit [Muribaculum sp.]|nr:Mfa1 family fimbria major subunit [Muribaculum sp.]